MISVAPATIDDIPVLCSLLLVLFNQEAEFSADKNLQSQGLEMIISEPSMGVILVAKDTRGEICGMINVLYTVSTFLGSKVCTLEDMVVFPDVRGNGVGSILIKSAVEKAKSEGCKRITLLTDQDNQRAISFYEQHGFSKSTMMPMRRLL